MMLAIIGGSPRRFQPFVDLYREAQDKLEISLPLGVHSPGHVADTDEQARDRAGLPGSVEDKGHEAAAAALATAEVLAGLPDAAR